MVLNHEPEPWQADDKSQLPDSSLVGHRWGEGLGSDAHCIENQDRDELGQAVEGHVLEDAERSVQGTAALPRRQRRPSGAQAAGRPRLTTPTSPARLT